MKKQNKTEKNLFWAFILNFGFAIFELLGGIFTGSVAILSDSVHDIGDAFSIGLAYFLEKKSKKQPDEKYTYGYARFSVLGGIITTLVLIVGAIAVLYNAVRRIIEPKEIDYNGMILFAIVGVIVNLSASLLTRKGETLNQKAVNLHLLEDVLGWVVVLIGAIVMRFTGFVILDPILSICVAIFILFHAIKNIKETTDLFLEKTPKGLNIHEIKTHLLEIDGVVDIHHIHLRSLDGVRHYATLHAVITGEGNECKAKIRAELKEHGITHATIETESAGEDCPERECKTEFHTHGHCCHHHH